MAKGENNSFRRERHDERVLYTVWALWLIGFSEQRIGMVVGRTRKQISGIVARSPYPNRSAMSDQERQAKLDELIKIRLTSNGRPLDGGVLDQIPHKIIPLRATQRKG